MAAEYVVRNAFGDYWHEGQGWVGHLDMATVYSQRERLKDHLPIGGYWEDFVDPEE